MKCCSILYCGNHWCHQLQPHCLWLGLQDSLFHCHDNPFFPPRGQWATARSLGGWLFSVQLLATQSISIHELSEQWGTLNSPRLPNTWVKAFAIRFQGVFLSHDIIFCILIYRSPYFFSSKALFLTSFHSLSQKLSRICKRSEILSYLQAKRLVCHNCTDAVRRHKTPGSYIKDFIFNGTERSQVPQGSPAKKTRRMLGR